ncbi:hypothetical protein BX666DRAFT_1972676 [Dichotomocladium elegans]|nr:hypothetical protein BX666DRAFT_1972676 [Dichotomocladium elegans]
MAAHNPPIASSNAIIAIDSEESLEKLVGNYIIKAKIGQGSFATVYKAQHKAGHPPIVI